MEIRQYIGARYTPKFMGTYDNTQVYETLSVVDNGLGTSYICGKPTPAGTPLTDTEYWHIYGASSGAIINLQNQIGDLTDLDTTDKDSLVDAINENVSEISALTNKIGFYVTPEDYGAVGDGVSDDTTAIQSALDTEKNVVLVGTYLVTNDLTIKHRGDQPEYEKQIISGGRIILHDATIKGDGNYRGGVVFVNVCFTSDGHYTTPAITFDNQLIRTKFLLCKFRLIDYVADMTASNPAFTQESQFINCHFQDGIKAFMLDNSIFAVKIERCDINNYSSYGIEFGAATTAQNVIISENVIENNGIAIKMNHVLRNVVIEKNYFEGNTTSSIDLTWLESDASSYCNGLAIRENYFYMDDDKDCLHLPYRIVNRLSTYISGAIIPIMFERNAILRGANQTQDSYYIPNGTPNNYTLDFKFVGNEPSNLQNYLHKYDVKMMHKDFIAASAYNADTSVTLMTNADLLTALGVSVLPRDFAIAIRNTEVRGTIYIAASTGNVRFHLDENMAIGQSISWSYIYK